MKELGYIIKWTSILLLIILLVVDVYIRITNATTLRTYSIVLLLALIIVLLYPCKLSWSIGILLFLYGIYNVVFVGIKSSEPTIMQFTAPLFFFIPENFHRNIFVRILNVIPDFFYLIGFIVFLTRSVRQYYKVYIAKKI